MASILWKICSFEAAQRGQLHSDEGLTGFWIHPITDAPRCVPRQQFVRDGPLFKSRGLVSAETVSCDLTLMGQIVPVKSDCLCLCRGGVCVCGGGEGGHIFSGRQGEMERPVFASLSQRKRQKSGSEQHMFQLCVFA